MIREAIIKLSNKENLSYEEAEQVMNEDVYKRQLPALPPPHMAPQEYLQKQRPPNY